MIQFDRRVGVFVDSANIHATSMEAFGKKVSYDKLLKLAVGNNKLYRAIIYAVRHENTTSSSTLDDWKVRMEQFGYEVRLKDIQRWNDGRTKADWDIGMTMDVVRMLEQIDEVIIVSGDGDFVPLVQYCQSKGRIVKAIGVERSTHKDLKAAVDYYCPIRDDLLFAMPAKRPRARQEQPQNSNGFGSGL